ncbi:uncharacterized protein MELLADRAFT_78046 [Melampsora larici-populina 98AG31]|uniref:Uncharacterized protein n=1 Tax=Melampsora larici-populina (strain 98AG31 / pathotype 3-4-7) TaxID=747676 RepID=F4RPL9_MELLP|nr:uncharacterized protein MELLADRAFT_78046 [Melampsora larici-populina 98AG31]EGG05558.1 hypothetical protein MELLADRAFT_78046 [Melampsora larici-populina 98AG31]
MYNLIPPNHLKKHDTPPRKSLKRRASSIIESLTTTFSHSGISSTSDLSNIKPRTPIIITTPDLKIHTKIELNQFSALTQRKLNHHHRSKPSKFKTPHHYQPKDTLDSNSNISDSKSNIFQDFLNLNSNSKNQKDKQNISLRTSQSKSYQNQSKHPYQSSSKQHHYHYSKSRFTQQNTMRSKGMNISSLEEVMMNHFGSGDQTFSSNLSFYNHTMPHSKSGLSLNSNRNQNHNQKENQNSEQMVIDEVDDPLGLFSPTGRVPVKRSLNQLNSKPLGIKVKTQTTDSKPFSILSPNPFTETFSESSKKPDQSSQKNENQPKEENTPTLSQSTGSNSISSFYSLNSSLNQSQPATVTQTQAQQRLQMTFQNSLVNFNSESKSVSPIERFSILKNPSNRHETGSVWSMVNPSDSLQSLSSNNVGQNNPSTTTTITGPGTAMGNGTGAGSNLRINSLRKKLSQGFKGSLHKRFRKA